MWVPLKVAAKIYPEEQVYFDQRIAPLLRQAGSLVEFVGEITDQGRNELLGTASALLFPIDWPEPFGLVMIEALACGTPVIAWRRGSVPEVLEHGVTGYIVDNIMDAVDAVGRIGSLRRSACRETFERRFDVRRMAIDYVNVYERVIENARAVGLHNGAVTIAP
jgi:glycosyltransferase involved in cell wall biosynthesis